MGVRTALAAPLLHENHVLGCIHIRRKEVRPFSDKQIKLLKTFADQAVIAIENVRLFRESQSRNRDLTESLEQQTATSEILGVIASSPTDIQPVLDTIAESAARVCSANDALIRLVEGNSFQLAAHHGSIVPGAGFSRTITRGSPIGRAVVDRQTIHVHDIATDVENEYPESKTSQLISGARTLLATPLLREGVSIGVILIRRTEVRPFTDKQIALLKTFADQAVIAIENVHLFQELQTSNRQLTESLEQQTATSEILGVIASSPTDVQPVLDTIAESAARLCEADDAIVRRLDGNVIRLVAHYGSIPPGGMEEPTVSRGMATGRAIIDMQKIHIPDMAAAVEN